MPKLDYIDRTSAGKPKEVDERKIFFDELPQPSATVGAGFPQGLIAYEESADAAKLYNPMANTQKTTFSGVRVKTGATLTGNSLTGFASKPLGGRIKPVDTEIKTKVDPVDIDDDVSEQGPGSIA